MSTDTALTPSSPPPPPPAAPERSILSRRPLEVQPATPPATPATTVLLVLAAVATLYFGRDIFIPLALAILLSFALGPLVTRLYRLGLPRAPAVVTVVALVLMLVLGFGVIVANQVVSLAIELPRYEANLRAKAHALATAVPGGGVVERTADVLRDVGRELENVAGTSGGGTAGAGAGAPKGGSTAAPGQQQPQRPIPVEVHQPPASPLQALSSVLVPLLQPIATIGVALVFIVFVLLQREDLRDRIIRLFGARDVHRATEALDDAAKRIGRYLLMQLVVNIAYGVPVGIGLWLIGVPNALLWGLLATVLRFIPYLGPILAALFPIMLSLAVQPGWTTPLLTLALFVGLELFSNNVMEPWLYGSSTGLSPLAIIVAAVFWTSLWGAVGLLLATPLTVCLVVIGRYVPQLQFFEVLLGDVPVLPPDVKFYQRLLANDPQEAEEVAEEVLEERASLASVYAEVIVPALAFGDQDRQRGALDRAQAAALAGLAREIADALAEDAAPAAATAATATVAAGAAGEARSHPDNNGVRILWVGGRSELDEVAGHTMVQLLRREGFTAEATSAADALVTPGRLAGFDVVCLSYLDPTAVRQARRLVHRLRARLAAAGTGDGSFRGTIWVALWGMEMPEADAVAATGADTVVGSLPEALRLSSELVRKGEAPPPPDAAAPPPAPAEPPPRQARAATMAENPAPEAARVS